MKLLKSLQKSVKAHHLLILGVVVAGIALYFYSSKKSKSRDMMTVQDPSMDMPPSMATAPLRKPPMPKMAPKPTGGYTPPKATNTSGVKPAAPLGQNETQAEITGIKGREAGLSNCAKQAKQDPVSLLPKDENSEWARLNPSGKGTLDNVNLLKAGYHVGIDTVGNTLRNANLQVRSEPPNPQTNVGPWNNTTIAPDLMRVPLEIGCGPQ